MFSRLKKTAQRVKLSLALYRLILKDPRTPLVPKLLLGASIAYLLSPIDLIPDFIPILGQLDDLVIVPLLIYLALVFVPKSVLEDARRSISLVKNV